MFTALKAEPRFNVAEPFATSFVLIPAEKVCSAVLVDSVAMRGYKAFACSSLKEEEEVAKSAELKIGFGVGAADIALLE